MATTSAISKEPPNSKESEKLILGAMLNNVNYLNQAATELQEEDFYFLENKIIFRVLQDAFKHDESMDLHLTAEELRRQKKLDIIGGSQYLAALADAAGMTLHMQTYIDILRSKSILRKMLQAAKDIFQNVAEEPRDVISTLDSAQNALFRISQTSLVTPYILVADKLKGTKTSPSFLKQLEEKQEFFRAHAAEGGLPLTGLRTYFHDLDQMINGFAPSNLMILAARPAMGKTALALNIVENMCFHDNIPIGIFSLEMTADQLVSRIVCSRARVESKKINLGDVSGQDFQRVVSVVNEMQGQTLLIDDQPGIKITDLRSRARRMKESFDIQFLVIDYLQLLSGTSRYMDNRQAEITEISRMLKTLARELHIPILCLSQLSRKVEDRANHRPMMSDLRESGSIEQDSDLVMFLLRREYYDPNDKPGLGELIVAKNRHGSIGSVQLVFEKQFASFQNYASGDLYLDGD